MVLGEQWIQTKAVSAQGNECMVSTQVGIPVPVLVCG